MRLLARGFLVVVFNGLLRGVGREEAGEVAVLVVAQRDEAEFGEFEFACFRDQDFGRDSSFVCRDPRRSCGWAGFLLLPPDCGPRTCYTPAVFLYGCAPCCGEGEGGIAPQ